MAAKQIPPALTKSEQMSRVRYKDTKPERLVRRALSRFGVRYRLHRPDLPGRPDVFIPRLQLAVFVNGCFWHGHDCSRARRPRSNVEFWAAKLDRNIARDIAVLTALKQRNIEPVVLWTCELDKIDRLAEAVAKRYKSTCSGE